MEKFNIGDNVYNARCQWASKRELCPICFGKLQVTLVLGNNDSVILPCNYCAPGFEYPTGCISIYDYIIEAELVTITDIKVEISSSGEIYKYHSGCYSYDTENLFTNKEDALKRAVELKEVLDRDQEKRIDWIKKDKKKSFSWDAGYHLRHIKDLKKEIERHEQKAVLCKQRAKE